MKKLGIPLVCLNLKKAKESCLLSCSKYRCYHIHFLFTFRSTTYLFINLFGNLLFGRNCYFIYCYSQPIQLLTGSLQVAKPGKFLAGRNELAFEFPLKAKGSRKLFETYHGVFVNIQVQYCIQTLWNLLLPQEMLLSFFSSFIVSLKAGRIEYRYAIDRRYLSKDFRLILMPFITII